MTHIELRDLLMDRVGWKQSTNPLLTVSSENVTTKSGRCFQDEYPAITLMNVYETMETPNADHDVFDEYLKKLKQRAIILVISDVFYSMDIDRDILVNRHNLFDDCISKRMAIVVGETILNSTRSNRTEAINKEQMQQLFFEINGSQGNPNFPNYIGLKSRYGICIERIQDGLDQNKALDVFTFGVPDHGNQDSFRTW